MWGRKTSQISVGFTKYADIWHFKWHLIQEQHRKLSTILFPEPPNTVYLIGCTHITVLFNKKGANQQVSTFSASRVVFLRAFFTFQGPFTHGFKKELPPKADPVRSVLWPFGTHKVDCSNWHHLSFCWFTSFWVSHLRSWGLFLTPCEGPLRGGRKNTQKHNSCWKGWNLFYTQAFTTLWIERVEVEYPKATIWGTLILRPLYSKDSGVWKNPSISGSLSCPLWLFVLDCCFFTPCASNTKWRLCD